MTPKRRRRKEEEEELQKRKKALKKAYQKDFSSKKRVGSKGISEIHKYILVGSIAIIVIVIVAFQFIKPPPAYCYYTEGDFIYATLDQDSENIAFNHIVAWYQVTPKNVKISCDIQDYYDFSFDFILPNYPSNRFILDGIEFQLIEESSTSIWTVFLENGTPLQMSSWVNLTDIYLTPPSIDKNSPTIVNFRLDIITCIPVDLCNISLEFNKNLENTSIEFSSITEGTADSEMLSFFTQKENIPANTHVVLDFNLAINTNFTLSELNLLKKGKINLEMNDKLIVSFIPDSNFKESQLSFSESAYENNKPTLIQSKFLNIIIEVPYYNITIN
ncbi:MAG: hypothetical protein ACFFD2_17800 [Promethearchaeota archaeon]